MQFDQIGGGLERLGGGFGRIGRWVKALGGCKTRKQISMNTNGLNKLISNQAQGVGCLCWPSETVKSTCYPTVRQVPCPVR